MEVARAEPLTDVSVAEVLSTIGIEPAHWTRADQMRVGAYLKSGLGRYRNRAGTNLEWRYRVQPGIRS